jgi:hypothetical protein
MDYKGNAELWRHQWKKIQDPERILLAFLEDEEEGEMAGKADERYYLAVDGKKTIEIDMKELKQEFDNTTRLSNEELNQYAYKKIQLFVLRNDNNRYELSTLYIKNGKESKKTSDKIVWDINQSEKMNISFTGEKNESVHMYYATFNKTYPVYEIEIIRVTPNVAYKQNGKSDYIIRDDRPPYQLTNKIGLSGNKVSLCPVFFTYREKQDGIKDITSLLERNKLCSHLIDSIRFNDKEFPVDNGLDWIEFPLDKESSVYAIKTGENITRAVIETVKNSFPVTVTRNKGNEDTGYYIEDYYSAVFTGIARHPSLRDNMNTMKTGEFDVLGMPYKIPVIHYKNPCSVRLNLTEIPSDQNPNPIQYKIGEKAVGLGEEFNIQTLPNGTILDIKDLNGNIMGKIEFRQIIEPLLSPVLNIVSINTNDMGVHFSTVINDLNAIYNTMNVSWQQGKQIKLDIGANNEKLSNIKVDNDLQKTILQTLRNHPDYKSNQYYMIISPVADNFGGWASFTLSDNWFFIQKTYDKRIPAHELGHCNGLDEFVVNIGVLPGSDRDKSIDEEMQYNSSNVMGYSHDGTLRARPLKDFYSWQIPVIRKHIEEQLNKK